MEYTGFWNQVNQITHYEMLRGNSQDIQNLEGALEIRSDLQVERVVGTNIWGTLTDCHNNPLSQQVVKLIRRCESDEGEFFKVVDCVMTDCNGYYRFDTYGQKNDEYNILVESPEPVIITVDSKSRSNHSQCNCMKTMKSSGCESPEEAMPMAEIPIQIVAPKGIDEEQWHVSHQMNAYDYTQDEPIYRSLNNRSGAKFYANNTYPYRMK